MPLKGHQIFPISSPFSADQPKKKNPNHKTNSKGSKFLEKPFSFLFALCLSPSPCSPRASLPSPAANLSRSQDRFLHYGADHSKEVTTMHGRNILFRGQLHVSLTGGAKMGLSVYSAFHLFLLLPLSCRNLSLQTWGN